MNFMIKLDSRATNASHNVLKSGRATDMDAKQKRTHSDERQPKQASSRGADGGALESFEDGHLHPKAGGGADNRHLDAERRSHNFN